ncbi:MAG: EF-hand domain-containing protein [Deltaproteobacteria bacterium]|nr:EF-hand domain-containing protein [Deltaproteobacteria bacterium]
MSISPVGIKPPKPEPQFSGSASKADRFNNLFKKLDQDQDGSISKSELEKISKRFGSKVDELFKSADKDSDGKISKSEFVAMMYKMKPRDPANDVKPHQDPGVVRPRIVNVDDEKPLISVG